jgi:hypothetical protein
LSDETTKGRVAVVVPLYNRVKTLDRYISQLKASGTRTKPDHEIIFVDEGRNCLLRPPNKRLRFFGIVRGGVFGFGFLVSSYVAVWWATGHAIGDRAHILLLAVLCLVLGVQTVFMGLIGEIIILHTRMT